jgi:hypothetical protein
VSPALVLAAALALAAAAAPGQPGHARAAAPASADDLRALAALTLPRALVEGLVDGLATESADRAARRVPRAREAEVRAKARAAAEAAAARALPEPALLDFGATLLGRHHDGAEVRALLAWYRSPLARKVDVYRREAAAIETRLQDDPPAAEREKAALTSRSLTPAERQEVEAFAASDLGRKSARLAPELTVAWLDFLERRVQPERAALDAALDGIVAAATPAEAPGPSDAAAKQPW